jgi:outer membrane receptor protein involved in Fe transport
MKSISKLLIVAPFLLCLIPWTATRAQEQKTLPPMEADTTEEVNNADKKTDKSEQPHSEKPVNRQSSLMPEVVVTATRTEENALDVPQSVTIVNQEDIERRQPRTPNQMLREEPGIFTVESAAQGSPIIRGL